MGFLSELSGVAWDLAKKRELVTPGKLIPEDRSNGPHNDACAVWLQNISSARKIDANLPERFEIFVEPSWDEREKHRRAAAFIAHLPELYKKSLKVLQDVDIDLIAASESAIASALKKHGMPRLCITCLNKFSLSKLISHLVKTTLANLSHIYSLESLKEEREIVRDKIEDGGSEEA